jgi:hypothetical protein
MAAMKARQLSNRVCGPPTKQERSEAAKVAKASKSASR